MFCRTMYKFLLTFQNLCHGAWKNIKARIFGTQNYIKRHRFFKTFINWVNEMCVPCRNYHKGFIWQSFSSQFSFQKNLKHTKKHWKFSVIIRIFVFSCVPNVINLFVVTYLYFGPPLLLSFLLTAQTKHIWQKISNNKICRFVWLIDDIYKLIL